VNAIPDPAILSEASDVVHVARSYMRAILAQGTAIAWLADSGAAECSYSNLRSLFEAYLDLRFLLTGERQGSRARRVILYAMHDLLETADTLGLGGEERDGIRDGIAAYADEDPPTYAAFLADWSQKRRSHWSGMTRSSIMRALDPEPLVLTIRYKAYSWESHGVLSAVLDHVRDASGHAGHEYRQSQAEVAAHTCVEASWSILASWGGMKELLPRS
jgi:hypothetical protein